MRPRDMQKRKLYSAERSVSRTRVKSFNTIGQVKAYTRRILKHKWFQERWPYIVNVNVRKMRSDSNTAHGWYEGGGTINIELPPSSWGYRDIVILHEIAHGLCDYQHGHGNTAWHGPEYARIFASLVQHYMGVDAGRELKHGYRKYRVKYRRNGHA